jgi:ATP-dependent helicase/DNAse subunit B
MTPKTTKNTTNTGTQPKKRWLSPSSINTYMRCPHKFFLQYVKRMKSKLNIHLLRGGIVHKTLERFFREGYTDASHYDTLRAHILTIFNEEWKGKKDQLIGLKLEDTDLAFYYQDSQKMVINWLHDWLRSEVSENTKSSLEESIFNKKWMLCGRIDRIIRNRSPPLVIDYKTCKSIDTSSEEYRRQMAIYHLLYNEKYLVKPDTAIHFLKFPNGLRNLNPTPEEIEDIKRLILEIHDKTRSTDPEDYPCTCGGWCKKEFGIT